MSNQRRIKTPLYSRNSSGNIIEWILVLELTPEKATISQYYGRFGKSLANVPTSYVITQGKNIGKSNETTIEQQALNEITSLRAHKLNREGYVVCEDMENIETIVPFIKRDENGFTKPMKCQPFYKTNGKVTIKFPCFAQPKINGFRCSVFYRDNKVFIKSKNGIDYDILFDIKKEYHALYNNELLDNILLSKYGISVKDLVFDGEAYIHGEILSEISSAVRKLNLKTNLIKHYVFDLSIPNYTQTQRITMLNTIFNNYHFGNNPKIILVPTLHITSIKEAIEIKDSFIIDGYEGAVFRDMKAEYAFGKRPATIVKLKKRDSAEFVILDVLPMTKSPNLGMFLCRNDINNNTFTVVPEGSHDIKATYLKNKEHYIGKLLTVEFYERTKTGLPFNAVGIDIRDYE